MVKALLRSVGRMLPQDVQLRLARGRPAAAWLIQPGQVVVFDRFLGGFTIEAHTDSKIERQMLTGTYEPHLQRILDQYVQPGDVCLDIGANVGAMSLSLAKRAGHAGSVHAFEPAPMLFERLQRNIALNPSHTPTITAHNLGVGAQSGTLHWLQSSAGEGNGRLLEHAAPGSISVAVVTLDTFAADNDVQRIDFMKIDVERMELEVVRGGRALLAAHMPVILFETLPCHGIARLEQQTQQLLEVLGELGYEVYGVGRRGLSLLAPGALPGFYESLALPRGLTVQCAAPTSAQVLLRQA